MDTVGAYEAKTHLPRLLLDVAHGRSVTITKHGVPVARLVPPDPDAAEPASVIAALKQARVGVTLGDLSLRELLAEGRRIVPLVIDASVTMAWCFEDESSALADAVLDSLADDYALVPALWRLEIANVLLVAERRGRVTQAQADRFVSLVGSLPIRLDETVGTSQLVTVGRLHNLSAYDAAYLATASNSGLPLASNDERLLAAAKTAGVRVVGDPASAG